MGVYVAPMRQLRQAHLGAFWDQIRDEFPRVEDLEPSASMPNPLDDQPTMSFTLEMGPPPIRRALFYSGDLVEVLQVQGDRFVQNWRKVEPGTEYPRYEPLRDRFTHRVAAFESVLNDAGVAQPAITMAEISYVNALEVENLADAFTLVAPPTSLEGTGGATPRPEHYAARCNLISEKSEPVGALFIEASPMSVGYALTLTVRGPATDLSSAFELIRHGRSVLVRSFAEVTTPTMHERWERTQ